MRAGSRALSIFANALNARVLRAHLAGPLRPSELDSLLGWAPQSSLRASVAKLCEHGALVQAGAPGETRHATELTEAGRQLMPVADALERWLQKAPGGSVPLDDAAARGIIRVLTAGWDSTVIRILAERAHTQMELSARVSSLNYPALKRRLAKLRSTSLVETTGDGASTYRASPWLRQAAAPLVLAGRWEHEHDVAAAPISPTEIEAAFLLALPLIALPERASGSCSLAVLSARVGAQDRGLPAFAGVEIGLDRGELIFCRPTGNASQQTWALGTIDDWFRTVIDGESGTLRLGGSKPGLARELTEALHATLSEFLAGTRTAS